MKKSFYYLVAFAASAASLLSCNKEVSIDDKIAEPVLQESFEYDVRIVDQETKTTLEDGVVTWEANDQLGFYTSTDTYNTFQKITTISPEVKFKIYLSSALDIDDELYAYFPYKSNASASTDGPTKVKMQIPAEQSGDFDAMPQVSKVFVATEETASGATIDLEFINLGSVAEFLVFSDQASYRAETISSITFSANKACAGSFTFDVTSVNYDSPSTLTISGYEDSEIVVTTSPTIGTDKASAGVVDMVLAPGSYTGTVTVATDEATYTYTISTPMTFDRAHKKPLGIKLDASHRTPYPKKTYKKITSAPADWEGEYILVNSAANSVMTGSLSGNYLGTASVSANMDGTITCLASYGFTIEEVAASTYSLKNSSGKYISLKASGSTNASLLDDASSTNARFALDLSATGLASINSKLQTTRYLTFGSGSDWRFYASDANRGYLYALYDTRTLLTTPVVTASAVGTTITASWEAVPNATDYVVTLSDGSEDTVTGTSKEFTGVSTGTYTVSVVARPLDAVTYKESLPGVSGSVVIGTPVLVSPTITSLKQTETGFSASWSAGDAYATSYDWEFRSGSVDGTVLGSGSTSSTSLDIPFASLSIDKFTAGTDYYLVLTAKAAGYTSSASVNSYFTATSSTTVSITTFSTVSGSIDSNISYAAIKGTGTTDPVINSNKLRLYKPASGKSTGSQLTVTAASGYKITAITFRSNNGRTCKYSTDGGSLSDNHTMGASTPLEITGISAQTVEYYNTGDGNLDINTIEVTYSKE